MPFPNYTADECITRVIELDAEIAKISKLATSFSVDKKRFDFSGKLAELREERALWESRYNIATDASTTTFEGPRTVPV